MSGDSTGYQKMETWQGANYLRQLTKLLIVGESNYYKTESERVELASNPNWNIENIRDSMKNKHTPKAFKEFYSIIQKDCRFWDDVAFTNLIQKPLNVKERPTSKDLNNSILSLIDVIRKVKPDIVLFWGVTFKNKIKRTVEYSYESFDDFAGKFKFGSESIDCFTIYHPAHRSINKNDWFNLLRKNDKIREALKL